MKFKSLVYFMVYKQIKLCVLQLITTNKKLSTEKTFHHLINNKNVIFPQLYHNVLDIGFQKRL